MTEYVKIPKDEYDKLKEIERNHRYLLSGELSYSNSVNKKLEDLKEWLKEEIDNPWFSNNSYREQGLKEVLERLG